MARIPHFEKFVSDSRYYQPQHTPTVLQGGSTTLAHELNARMSGIRGYFARRRYARVWGCRWEPLPLDLPAIAPLTTERAQRSMLATVR